MYTIGAIEVELFLLYVRLYHWSLCWHCGLNIVVKLTIILHEASPRQLPSKEA